MPSSFFRSGRSVVSVGFLCCLAQVAAFCSAADKLPVVAEGKAVAAREVGPAWEAPTHGLAAEGTGRFLLARAQGGAGDFRLTARLALARLDGSAASFEIADSRPPFSRPSGPATAPFKGRHPKSKFLAVSAAPPELRMVNTLATEARPTFTVPNVHQPAR